MKSPSTVVSGLLVTFIPLELTEGHPNPPEDDAGGDSCLALLDCGFYNMTELFTTTTSLTPPIDLVMRHPLTPHFTLCNHVLILLRP